MLSDSDILLSNNSKLTCLLNANKYNVSQELQARAEEAEESALRGGKRAMQQLETRVNELQQQVEKEQRRYGEAQKRAAAHVREEVLFQIELMLQERRGRDLHFQVEEYKKNQERLQELVTRLQNKLNASKRQIDEAVGSGMNMLWSR